MTPADRPPADETSAPGPTVRPPDDNRAAADESRRPTVLAGGTVVTMNSARDVLRADVLVGAEGEIEALLPPGSPLPPGARIVDASGCLVVPGLVQAHLHLCQTLFRGLSEERPLLAWLRQRIWPLEAAHDAVSLRASARLGIAELLSSGTTALLDMGTVHHTEQLFLAAEECGIRYTGGQALMDRGQGVPPGLMQPTEAALAESDALFARWDGAANGRLRYAYAPRFILSCSAALMEAIVERAKRGARVHTHASEQEEELAVVRAEIGRGDLEYFAEIGLTGPWLVLAHCVWLQEAGMAEVARSGTHVTHCPASNLKLSSGLAPVRALLDRGINVALGADGAACSNRIDGWRQLWLAAEKRCQSSSGRPPDSLRIREAQAARRDGFLPGAPGRPERRRRETAARSGYADAGRAWPAVKRASVKESSKEARAAGHMRAKKPSSARRQIAASGSPGIGALHVTRAAGVWAVPISASSDVTCGGPVGHIQYRASAGVLGLV